MVCWAWRGAMAQAGQIAITRLMHVAVAGGHSEQRIFTMLFEVLAMLFEMLSDAKRSTCAVLCGIGSSVSAERCCLRCCRCCLRCSNRAAARTSVEYAALCLFTLMDARVHQGCRRSFQPEPGKNLFKGRFSSISNNMHDTLLNNIYEHQISHRRQII